MKTVIKTTEVYEFTELNKDAKMRAINNHINFLLETLPYDEMVINMQKACDKAEHMKTPWFVGSYVYEYCLAEIMEELEEYEFLADGNIYSDNIKGV